jgi:hypothetical protein
MVVAIVFQFSKLHRVALVFDGVLSEVPCIDFVKQLFKFLPLSVGIASIVVAGCFDDVVSILLASPFECSSSDLTEDFPFSCFKEIVAIAELEQLLLQIDEESDGLPLRKV